MPQAKATAHLTNLLYVMIFANLLLFMPLSLDSHATPLLQNLPMAVACLTLMVFAIYLRQKRNEGS